MNEWVKVYKLRVIMACVRYINQIKSYYTKNYKRALKYLDGEYPKNYHLTYSLNEDNIQWNKPKLTSLYAVVFSVYGKLPQNVYSKI
mgnify:CR=1 FL=1